MARSRCPDATHTLLLEKHRELDYLCRHPGERIFISDWYCHHPFAKDYLPSDTFESPSESDLLQYCFQNDTSEIHEEIIIFHKHNDGVLLQKEEIYVGAGMTPLLTAQMLMLKAKGFTGLYYAKPLYYAFYYLAHLLNIGLTPICDTPLNRPGVHVRLPRKKSCLIICDPLWYMGRYVLQEYMVALKAWQAQTGSLILVDGGFQYMRWDTTNRKEASSMFDRELTFRSICPTKALAVHGVRFSYTLLPRAYQEDMRYAYANACGSSCIFSHKAACRIMKVLNARDSNCELLRYIQGRYNQLVGRHVFIDDIGAEATYFVFAKLLGDASQYIAMGQEFFDTTNYPDHVRFNVLLRREL